MNLLLLFFDMAPSGGVIGAVFGVGFFLLLAGVAFVAYKSLKKTLKWGVRIAIAAVILIIALAGSITLWWYGSSGGTQRPRPPAPTRPQR